jgi:hypothetical protein
LAQPNFHLKTALLEEERHKAGPENTTKPPPIYITDVKNISPFIQLLEQIAKQKYESQVKVLPKTSEWNNYKSDQIPHRDSKD